MKRFDLFVIGAGSAGVRAARRAAEYGACVAITEADRMGGTCVNVGCIPKKLFFYASHYAELFQQAKCFGWRFDALTFDSQKLIKNTNREIERLNQIYKQLLDRLSVEILAGSATLIDPHHIQVGQTTYSSEHILIATGAQSRQANFLGHEHVVYSDEMFTLGSLPKQIAIIGGGYIAVEFAGILQGFGVQTNLIYHDQLFLRGFDEGLRRQLAKAMDNKGIRLYFDAKVVQIEKKSGGLLVSLTSGDRINCDLVLAAIGRIPNTVGLGLTEVGVLCTDGGLIKVNDNYQTSVSNIYAIGDVSNRINLTPVALAEGDYIASMLYAKGNIPLIDYANIPTCVFSQPNLACVGLTEQAAREKHANIDVYQTNFRALQLSLTDNKEHIFIKMVVDRDTDQILGVHMLGGAAAEIIQSVAIALNAGATKSSFDRTMAIHPTIAEELVTMRLHSN